MHIIIDADYLRQGLTWITIIILDGVLGAMRLGAMRLGLEDADYSSRLDLDLALSQQ
jgi:hypothetical protein